MSLLDQLLARDGKTRADVLLARGGELPNALRREGVPRTTDIDRVLALPRREPATDEFVELLSAVLRKRSHDDEGNPNLLRPKQAEALRDLYEVGGLFAPMRVGSGKTLVTLLAATLLRAERPVLVLPAALFKKSKKTQREFAEYNRNWHVRLPRLISYEELGRATKEYALLHAAPDLLILDEAQMTRNRDAAVTRRIGRAIEALRPRVAVLSGTLMTDALMDYHHLAVWALGANAPLPLHPPDAEVWARALDRDVGTMQRIDLGALHELPGGFHTHFRGSRGVVPTPGSDCDASIEIRMWSPDIPPELRRVIEDTERAGMRPDGELLDELELPDCLSQLALGFWYRWDPMPPDWWLDPRRAWRSYVRGVLDAHLPGYDSESQIVAALDREERPAAPPLWYTERDTATPEPPGAREGRALLRAWRVVRDRFTPNTVPVWLTRSIVESAAAHANAGDPCLVWTRYRAVGHALDALGVPYYGGGTNPEPVAGQRSIALSIASHGTGKNLQAWHRSLVLTPMANPDAWEQLIGREHRAGQRADVVSVDIINAIEYHGAVLGRVVSRARATSRASGFSQKLVDATWL